MVNTEQSYSIINKFNHYNILNIVVNTERMILKRVITLDYNILNIVVNTEQCYGIVNKFNHYNILNIVVNTELIR